MRYDFNLAVISGFGIRARTAIAGYSQSLPLRPAGFPFIAMSTIPLA